MIILTPAQADQVRGLTTPGHALAPKPLANSNFALPEACTTDPAHAKFSAFLQTLPIVKDNTINPGTLTNPTDPFSPITGSDWSSDAVLNAASTYESQWPATKTVQINLVTKIAMIDGVPIPLPTPEVG